MRHPMLGVGALGVAGLTLISLFLNFNFGLQIGGWPFAIGLTMLDLFKASLPVVILTACTAAGHSRIARAAAIALALPVWLLITGLSLQSAGGAALLGRQDSAGGRAGLIEKRVNLDSERARLLAKNPWTARIEQWKALPSAAIAAEIEGYKNAWAWKASEHCEKADGPKMRSYCQIFHTMIAAQGVAIEVEKDGKRLTEIEAELGKIPVLVDSDPLSAAFADLLAVKQKWVVYGWALLMALLLEAVPNLGPAILMLAYRLAGTGGQTPLARPGRPPLASLATGTEGLASGLPAPAAPEPADPEMSFVFQEDDRVANLAQYRLARLASGQTPLARPSVDRGPGIVQAAVRELGSGQHSLDAIMLAVKAACTQDGIKFPHRNRVASLLLEQGHESCGRKRIGGQRTTVYNLKGCELITMVQA
jgi:hypothetical protein